MGLESKKYKIGMILLIFISILLSGCVSNSTTSEGTKISEGTNIEEIDKGADTDDEGQTIDETGTENKAEKIDEGVYNQTEEEGIYNETNETDEEIYNETIDTNETNETDEEIEDNDRIESKEGYAIMLDGGKGLKIKLFVYNNQSNAIRSEGTLKAILYEKIEDSDEGPQKGKKLDEWTIQIKESDYGENNELVKILKYDNENVTSPSGFGYMDYAFTTIDGNIFKTSEEYINLVLE